MEVLYKKYVELRDEKKLTDYKVSKSTGITKSTFSDWKSGRSKPKLDKIIILAKFFEVPLEYFAEDIVQDKK